MRTPREWDAKAPRGLKPQDQGRIDRSAEALRHPKAGRPKACGLKTREP